MGTVLVVMALEGTEVNKLITLIILGLAFNCYADSVTTNLSITKPTNVGGAGSWGEKTNSNWDIVDT